MNAAFEERTKGLLVLNSLVPASQLSDLNSVREVCSRGFKVQGAGLSFHIGNVTLPGMYADVADGTGGRSAARQKARSVSAGRRLYEFLLVKVGVGRAYVPEDPSKLDGLDLPPEYDSFYLHHENDLGAPGAPAALEDPNSLIPLGSRTSAAQPQLAGVAGPAESKEKGVGIGNGLLPQHTFHHEYVIRDSTQALPTFLIHLEFDNDAEEKLALTLCDCCAERPSIVYCEADNARLCEECDEQLHGTNKLSMRHVRVPINEMPRPNGDCPEHEGEEAEFYCTVCRIPICRRCTSHRPGAVGEAALHKQINIREAYRSALQISRSKGSRFDSTKEYVNQQLKRLEDVIDDVQRNGRVVEDRIYSLVQEAVLKAQNVTEDRIRNVLSEEIETKHMLEQLDWVEGFLRKCQEELPPADFLSMWTRHCVVREHLVSTYAQARSMKDCDAHLPELRLDGGLKVSTVGRSGALNPRP